MSYVSGQKYTTMTTDTDGTHAIRFDASTTGNLDVAGGNCLIVWTRGAYGFAATSLVDSVEGAAQKLYSSVGARTYEAFIVPNCTAGQSTRTLTLTTNVGQTEIRWIVAEFDNVVQSDTYSDLIDDDLGETFVSGTSHTSTAITTTTTNTTVVSMMGTGGAITVPEPAGSETEIAEHARGQMQYEAHASAGSYQAAWTWSTAQAGACYVVALKYPADNSTVKTILAHRRENTLLRM